MNVQKERKSTFFIAFERRKKKLAACLLPNIDIAFIPECLCHLFSSFERVFTVHC